MFNDINDIFNVNVHAVFRKSCAVRMARYVKTLWKLTLNNTSANQVKWKNNQSDM